MWADSLLPSSTVFRFSRFENMFFFFSKYLTSIFCQIKWQRKTKDYLENDANLNRVQTIWYHHLSYPFLFLSKNFGHLQDLRCYKNLNHLKKKKMKCIEQQSEGLPSMQRTESIRKTAVRRSMQLTFVVNFIIASIASQTLILRIISIIVFTVLFALFLNLFDLSTLIL